MSQRVRAPRSDGQRNRAAILNAARSAFADRGPSVSLDEIARAAGVGNGTLYRHFPTRGALVDAACHDDAQGLIAAAADLMAGLPALPALREWLRCFIDHVAERNIVVEAVKALVAPDPVNEGASGAKVRDAYVELYRHAAEQGAVEPAFDPLDLLKALAGSAVIGSDTQWSDDAKALTDVLLAGLSSPARSRAG